MSLLAALATQATTPPVDPEDPPPTGTLVNLYPDATPPGRPTPIAHWDFRESAAPYYTTTATGNDLPLSPRNSGPTKVTTEIGDGLLFTGVQELVVPTANTGRLHIGGNSGTEVSVSAWVWIASSGQVAIAGIWGEFADPPQRQYALFYDLPAYGGNDMSCFHVSKDGAPTPGYPYSTDYSATEPALSIGQWHHLVGTYDGQQAVSYIDGIANARTTWATRAGDGKRNPYTFPLGLNSTPHEFVISTGAPLNGLLRDVKVWDQALTPGHVLTLAAEHDPLPPATAAPGTSYTLTGQQATDSGSSSGTYTFTGLPAGDPASGRLLVAALHGRYNPPRTLTSVTVGGVPATVVEHGGGLGFAYAVVPTGATVDVQATWKGQPWSHYCALFTVEGVNPTHTGPDGGVSVRGDSVTSGRGGVVLGIAHLAAETASWTAYLDRLTQGAAAGTTQQFSLMGGVAPGWTYPVSVSNGIGTTTRAFTVIAFDPA